MKFMNLEWASPFIIDIGTKLVNWLASNISDFLVGFGTIFLAYMAYRQIHDNNARFHTTDLKELINQWLAQLPEVQKSESVEPSHDTTGFESWSKESPLFSIESHILFKDIFHHKPEIKENWRNFKSSIICYDEKRKTLFEKINKCTAQRFEGFDFGDPTLVRGIDKGFPISIYLEAICNLKGEKSGYNYERAVKGINPNETTTSHVEIIELRYAFFDHAYFLAEITKDKEDEIKNIHSQLIIDCNKRYQKEIKDIIEMENKIRDIRYEFISMLMKMKYYTVFPRMDCEFVKPK